MIGSIPSKNTMVAISCKGFDSGVEFGLDASGARCGGDGFFDVGVVGFLDGGDHDFGDFSLGAEPFGEGAGGDGTESGDGGCDDLGCGESDSFDDFLAVGLVGCDLVGCLLVGESDEFVELCASYEGKEGADENESDHGGCARAA